MRASFLTLTACVILLSSCADFMSVPTIKLKPVKKKKGAEVVGEGAGGGMGGSPYAKVNDLNEDSAIGDAAPEEAGFLPMRVGEGVMAGGMLLPADNRIVWSSEDVNADIPFDKAFKNKPKKKNSWSTSYTEARRESMRTGKPILMWFTRTGSSPSPKCVALNRELLSTHEFGDWAKESVIRLKIDVSGGVQRQYRIEGEDVDRRKYAEKLKKQFHVLGYPSLIVLEPNGSVYSNERGFSRGEGPELWGKLKNAALTVEHGRGVYERKMAKKGYRKWTGANKGVVFAKLSRFHEKSGSIWLTEPDGNVVRTSIKFISKDDRGWIISEKERRGR